MKKSQQGKYKRSAGIRHFDRKGFSLVEVLVSVGILAVAIIGLLQVFIYCSILADSAENVTTALGEAQSKMEEIRNHEFTDIAVDYASGGTPGDTFSLSGLDGTGTITVSDFGGSAEILQLQIDIDWQNKDGRSQTVTLSSLIAER